MLLQAAERPLPSVARRELELPLDSPKVVALVGIRRSGKTYLLYDSMKRLLARGIDRRRLLYLNFEHTSRSRISSSCCRWPSAPCASRP